MIVINLLPPERRKAKGGRLVKALVLCLLLLLILVGSVAARYTYAIIPDLSRERDRLALSLQEASRHDGPERIAAAAKLVRERRTWSRALYDVKAAFVFTDDRDDGQARLSRAVGSPDRIWLDGFARGNREKAERLPQLVAEHFPSGSPVGRPTVTVDAWEKAMPGEKGGTPATVGADGEENVPGFAAFRIVADVEQR